jgi:hypothetical protein
MTLVAMWKRGIPSIHISNVEFVFRDGLAMIPQDGWSPSKDVSGSIESNRQADSLGLRGQSLKGKYVSVVHHAAVSNVSAVPNLGNTSIAFRQAECQGLDCRTG